jgi:hypothetical protein
MNCIYTILLGLTPGISSEAAATYLYVTTNPEQEGLRFARRRGLSRRQHYGFRACQPDAKGDHRLSVNLFRHKAKLEFSQDETGLKIKLPSEKPCDYACGFKITGLKLL